MRDGGCFARKGSLQLVARDAAHPLAVLIYTKTPPASRPPVPAFLPQSPASTPQIEAPLATNSNAASMAKRMEKGMVDGGWWVGLWLGLGDSHDG